jgi:Ca2+-binding EF-hand superfamily protein
MNLHIHVLVIVMSAVTYSSTIPTNEQNQRVYDQPLSDLDHNNGEHNEAYDHEAFLGREQAKVFDQLSPDESKAKLAAIVDKIDSNKDGEVTQLELQSWIKRVQQNYIETDTIRVWLDHASKTDVFLSWENYTKRTFGSSEEPNEGSPTFNYKKMFERDRKRWAVADVDQDGLLTKEEFQHFLHPEEAVHTKGIVVDETLEDIDKDGDGFISELEFVADLWPRSAEEEGQEEPDWIKSEREQFQVFRDKNKDGKLDKEEVMDWIVPSDYDHSEAEARHLIFESDVNKDQKLTKQEILDKYDLFVGSQATDYGEALTKHDEF